MNLQFYLEKLHNSKIFKEFLDRNPDAFFCSGFFSIDPRGVDNKQHIDYFIPSAKKMFSFQLENGIKLFPIEIFDSKTPAKIMKSCNFEFEEVIRLIKEKMQQENITNRIQKVFLSLQRLKNKEFIVGTAFISMLGILRFTLDISKMKIESFEKKSFLDMLKVIKK